jgi:hypothetical protein
MTQAAHHHRPSRFSRLTAAGERVMNTDGRPHPVQNALAGVTLLLGVIALVTAAWPGLHVISCWAGLAGIAAGGYGQMISATTAERFVLVIGMGAAGVGLFLGIAHGGPFG